MRETTADALFHCSKSYYATFIISVDVNEMHLFFDELCFSRQLFSSTRFDAALAFHISGLEALLNRSETDYESINEVWDEHSMSFFSLSLWNIREDNLTKPVRLNLN